MGLVTSNQENQNKNEKAHEQNEEHDVPAIDSKDRKLKSNAEKPVTEKAAEKDEKKVLEPETLVEEQAVKEIKDAVTITKKEDIIKEEAIEKKDPKAIEVPQAQDVKNKDSSLVKEKKMMMVKKKKKKGTTSDTTDTIQFEQIIDTKPEEPEPYIVDEPDSLSEDSSKEVVHTNEKLQIAEEIPVTTLDSSIQSLPSDQKEAEGLPTITVTNEKEKEQKRISIEEEVKKPAPKESAPQKVMKPKEEKPEVQDKISDKTIAFALQKLLSLTPEDLVSVDFPQLKSFEMQMALVEISEKIGCIDLIESLLEEDIKKGAISEDIGIKLLNIIYLNPKLKTKFLDKIEDIGDDFIDSSKQTKTVLDEKFTHLKDKQVILYANDNSFQIHKILNTGEIKTN